MAWGAWRLRDLPALGRPVCPEPLTWPHLSVVIAARDEADTIEPSLASLLAQDYSDLEKSEVRERA